MTVFQLVRIVWTLSAIGLIVLVMLHSPKGDGIAGIGGQAELFTSSKSAEKTLNRITWLLTLIFMGTTTVLSAGWLE
jgi:preprotein translocase subunit SecG